MSGLAGDSLVKYCPICGAENSRYSPFCESCGDADLSTVPLEAKRQDASFCVLELCDNPEVSFTVSDGQVVGRTDKADVVLEGVPNLEYISGRHARFLKRGEEWFVQHVGETNYIEVNGCRYVDREEVAICDGASLVISMTPFRVVLREERDAHSCCRVKP